MTQSGTRDSAEAAPGHYFGTSKKEKGKVLDEFTKVKGCCRVCGK